MRFTFLGLAAMAAVLASCSGDDDTSVKAANLLGKWYPVSDKADGITFPYGDHEPCGKDYWDFLGNGTVNDVDVYHCETSSYPGSWSLDGDQISVTFEGETGIGTVKKLNDSKLQIEFWEDYDDDGQSEKVLRTFSRSADF
jgi:hypothetical protein